MARPHKGARIPVALRIPAELHAELTAEAAKFTVDRHAFVLAMIMRGLKDWKKS